MLEGSVQRDQNRVRVNAQLIDAESGAHLWAERFEEDVADLFKLQDQVVARLAGSLGWEVTQTETGKGARSSNPDVIDLTMRGWTAACSVARGQLPNDMRESNRQARVLFDRALRVKPNDADALARSAEIPLLIISMGGATMGPTMKTKCLGKAIRQSCSTPTMSGHITQNLAIWVCRGASRKP